MLAELAAMNLKERLADNPYPGRGIVIGRNSQRQWMQVYWIMGRSANSRNRLFRCEGELLSTQAADPSKVADPSLIIYNAMRRVDQRYIVTNGAQTDGIYEGLCQGKRFVDSLLDWQHEPDAPNFTPRISGLVDLPAGEIWLSVIKTSPFTSERSEHHFFRYDRVHPGYGYAVTTYTGDGDPLPAFEGSPYLLALEGDAREIGACFWEALDEDNRISLAVRQIDPQTGATRTELINRYVPAGG